MVNKYARVVAAVSGFKVSEQTVVDYLELIMICRSALQQGDGLSWQDMEDAVAEGLFVKPDNYTYEI